MPYSCSQHRGIRLLDCHAALLVFVSALCREINNTNASTSSLVRRGICTSFDQVLMINFCFTGTVEWTSLEASRLWVTAGGFCLLSPLYSRHLSCLSGTRKRDSVFLVFICGNGCIVTPPLETFDLCLQVSKREDMTTFITNDEVSSFYIQHRPGTSLSRSFPSRMCCATEVGKRHTTQATGANPGKLVCGTSRSCCMSICFILVQVLVFTPFFVRFWHSLFSGFRPTWTLSSSAIRVAPPLAFAQLQHSRVLATGSAWLSP